VPLAVAVIAGALVLALGLVEPSRSDAGNLAALLAAVPSGPRGAAAVVGFALGALLLPIVVRSGIGLLAVTALVVVAWLAVGVPALDAAVTRDDSLKAFAAEATRRFPAPAPLVFAGAPIRQVVVYAGRTVPGIGRDEPVPPGTGVIATQAEWDRRAAAGRIGPALARARGRTGNVHRDDVVLAEAR
jgi:hypothetical protein